MSLPLHEFCVVCGWRKGGLDSWDGRACKCGLRGPLMCNVCGGPAPAESRCTNGRCGACHAATCTPGGITAPGHGRGPRTG